MKDLYLKIQGIGIIILTMCVLVYEFLYLEYGLAYNFELLVAVELFIVMMLIVLINLMWSSTLAKVNSISFFFGALFLMMIEIEKLQVYFTSEFILGLILFCGNLIIIVGCYLWVIKPKSQVIEVWELWDLPEPLEIVNLSEWRL